MQKNDWHLGRNPATCEKRSFICGMKDSNEEIARGGLVRGVLGGVGGGGVWTFQKFLLLFPWREQIVLSALLNVLVAKNGQCCIQTADWLKNTLLGLRGIFSWKTNTQQSSSFSYYI